jgi:hypothetical protein
MQTRSKPNLALKLGLVIVLINSIKNGIIAVVGGAVAILLLLTPMFIYIWYDHTQIVQGWVLEDFVEFQKIDIEWEETIVYIEDTESMLTQTRSATTKFNHIMNFKAYQQEMYDYKESMFDMIAVLVRNPDDVNARVRALLNIIDAQDKFYDAMDKFTNRSTFYVMRYTF